MMTFDSRPSRPSWILPALVVASGGLTLLTVAAVMARGINQDSAWYLHMVSVWLDGGTPYVDAVETNPPLIVLLTVPPVWLARLAGVSAIPVFLAYVFALALGGTALCARFVPRVWPQASPSARGLLTLGILFLLLPFPKSAFGQREHLAVIATLPYILLAAMRAAGQPVARPTAVAVGVLGALGFALKPHFLLAWLAVEVAVMLLRRSIRALWTAAPMAAAATFLAYAAVSVLAFPQYFPLARVVWQVYGGLNSPTVQLVQLRELQAVVVALAIAAIFKLPGSWRAPLFVIGASAFGFLAASLVQLKGWDYQMLPAQCYLALFFLVALTSVIEAGPALTAMIRGGAIGIAAAITCALLVVGGKYVYEAHVRLPTDPLPRLVSLVRTEAPRGPIAVLGMRTIVYPAFPLVNITGAAWSLREHSLWFLPGLYRNELNGPSADVPFRTPHAMGSLEQHFYEEIIGDLCRTPPRLLMIEAAPHFAPAGRRALDLIAYYGQDARFARLMTEYRQIDTVAPFLVYKADIEPSCGAPRPGA